MPTLNEVENVDALLSAIFAESDRGLEFEVLIADGGSIDGTVARIRDWERFANVRLVAGSKQRGLAGDVLTAAARARSEVVVVMDADLSHPPSRLRALVQPVLDGSSDMVVGSRFIPGGATPGWPKRRRLLSRLGGLVSRPLSSVRDPMSGYFAVRRERLLAVDSEASGFKIGLEILARGGDGLRVSEIPIVFSDRAHGVSKINTAQLVAFLERLFVLSGGADSAGAAARLAAATLLGVFVDLLVLGALSLMGEALLTAQAASFCLAAVASFVLSSRWACADNTGSRSEHLRRRPMRFIVVCLLALAIRGGVLAAAQGILGLSVFAAVSCAIGVAAVVSYLGSAFYVFRPAPERVPVEVRWRVAALGVVAYAAVLRLSFLGVIDLWPQEAYYWNYAQHLDVGYLDHPPMAAWLIWAGTRLFGNNELGVRLGAWLGWFTTAFFAFRLSARLYGRSAAHVTVLMLAALPFTFASGFLMTPDALLAPAWAGALCYLERALIGDRRTAWWGVGACFGIGMLSKYTIALLVPSVLLYLLADSRARGWPRRPQPYLAAALALLLFSPVIYWNLGNGLASFAFQSTRRLASTFHFSLPYLISSAALLLSPPVLIAVVVALRAGAQSAAAGSTDPAERRISRFVLVFTLAPLAVFVAFSLFREVKLNWTGPLWFAVIPAVSAAMLSVAERSSALEVMKRRFAAPTVSVLLVVFGLALNYLASGLPGVGFPLRLPRAPVAWGEFGAEAARLKHEVEQEAGNRPMLIGLDTYHIASALAFYADGKGDGPASSVGRGVLGRNGLMYGYWHHPAPLCGRPALLFAFKRYQIVDPDLARHFASLSDPMVRDVVKAGEPAGRFYVRVGYEFCGGQSRVPPPATTSAESAERAR